MVWLDCPYLCRALVVGAPLGFSVAHLRGAMAMSSSRREEAFRSREGLRELRQGLREGLREGLRGAVALAHLVVGAPLGFAVAHLRGAVARPFEHSKSQSGFLRLYRILKSHFVFLRNNKEATFRIPSWNCSN